ncbi:MAG: lipoprotein insertase outer membrane protein LolB [Panacagrimonas sp.]
MLRALILAATLVALPGCALLRSLPGDLPDGAASPAVQAQWNMRINELHHLDQFVLQGRIASGALGFKADLRWKQMRGGRFELRLAGPFGAGAAELSGDARKVQVRTGDDAPVVTAHPEAWLEEALGVRLPVSGLRWWVMGLPAPGHDKKVVLDSEGRALRIVQNGWELDYPEYRRSGDLDLPRRIEARNGDTRVLVLADSWGGLPAPKNPINPP